MKYKKKDYLKDSKPTKAYYETTVEDEHIQHLQKELGDSELSIHELKELSLIDDYYNHDSKTYNISNMDAKKLKQLQDNSKKLRILKQRYRNVSQEEQNAMLALRQAGASLTEISKAFSRSASTVSRICTQGDMNSDIYQQAEAIEKRNSLIFAMNANTCAVESMNPEKIDKASMLDLAKASGIYTQRSMEIRNGIQKDFNINIAIDTHSKKLEQLEQLQSNESIIDTEYSIL